MSADFVIVRRDGALWGFAAASVTAIARRGENAGNPALRAIELRFANGATHGVDAVVRIASELRPRPISARIGAHLPAGAAGLALFGGEPVVLLREESELTRD